MDPIASKKMSAADIEALERGPKNPLNGKDWPKDYKDKLLPERKALPVYQHRQAFLNAYNDPNTRALVVSAPTGSGKSTLIPPTILLAEGGRRVVACTQPRRLTTSQLAVRVAKELGVKYGEEVGSIIKGQAVVDKVKTKLVYMTEGSLKMRYLHNPEGQKFAAIILDEAHERTQDLDILCGFLKPLVLAGKGPKVRTVSPPFFSTRARINNLVYWTKRWSSCPRR